MGDKWKRRGRRLQQSWRVEVRRLGRSLQPRSRPPEPLTVARLHAMRVSLKRLRAMLRLTEKSPETRGLEARLRALSRASSARRNFDVSSALLKRMGARLLKTVPPIRAIRLPAGLTESCPQSSRGTLRRALVRARRAEKRARRRCLRAGPESTPEQLHDWRIRLKRLQHMHEALGMRVPGRWIKTAAWLGEVQDWAVLVGRGNIPFLSGLTPNLLVSRLN